MAVIGWILLAISAVLLVLLFTPVRFTLSWEQRLDGRVYVLGCIPVFTLKPETDRPTEKQRPEKAQKPPKDASDKPEKVSVLQELKSLYREEGFSGILDLFTRLAAIVGRLARGVLRAITVRELKLAIRIGGEEADAIAVNYGRVNAVLYPSLAVVSKAVRFRRKDVRVTADFTAFDTTVAMRATVWVWPFRLLGTALAALCRLIVLWVRCMPSKPATKQEDKPSVSVS